MPIPTLIEAFTATAAAAASTPPVAGYAAWFDASDTASITGSPGVSQWSDKSGNAKHAVQATSTNQPTTGTRTINGKNAIDWDNSNDVLRINPLTSPAPTSRTMFLVLLHDTGTGEDRIYHTTGFKNPWMISPSNTLSSYDGGWNLSTQTMPVGVAFVATLQMVPGSNGCSAWIDGNAITWANPPDVTSDLGTDMYLGDEGVGGSRTWDGLMAEIIIYDTGAPLNTTNRQLVEAYLKTKWGTP